MLKQNWEAVWFLEGICGRFGQREETNGDIGLGTSSHPMEWSLQGICLSRAVVLIVPSWSSHTSITWDF